MRFNSVSRLVHTPFTSKIILPFTPTLFKLSNSFNFVTSQLTPTSPKMKSQSTYFSTNTNPGGNNNNNINNNNNSNNNSNPARIPPNDKDNLPNNDDSGSKGTRGTWLSRFLGPKPEYPKYSKGWWWDKVVICTVFAVTGSSTTLFVRPVLENLLNVHGSLVQGPWDYRIAYIFVITPIYSVLLVLFGTLFARHDFFKKFAIRMWVRMIPWLEKDEDSAVKK
eukprot:TRINITY_DN882_c0_g1_i1.p1 TRINITY_DN882_c0_g1~~TRINITY_DN882_c0_g1_i1.p1  ORF type:complete len:222 (-),score=37.30 TRINITY_DN882_c0_g1_i1:129-794(-)